MVLGRLRALSEEMLNPLAEALASRGLTPNAITLLGLAASAAASLAYACHQLIAGALLVASTGLLDILDGAVARLLKSPTYFGATLDAVSDRYGEFLLIAGITLGGYVDWLIGLVALFSMVASSYARARAESSGGLRSCAVGIAERQEKLLIILVSSLGTLLYDKALWLGALLLAVLGQITVLQRLHYTYKTWRDPELRERNTRL